MDLTYHCPLIPTKSPESPYGRQRLPQVMLLEINVPVPRATDGIRRSLGILFRQGQPKKRNTSAEHSLVNHLLLDPEDLASCRQKQCEVMLILMMIDSRVSNKEEQVAAILGQTLLSR